MSGRHAVIWLAWLSGLCLAIAAGTSTADYSPALKCGQNSLFMFLVLAGHSEATLEDLEHLPTSSQGVSMLALRDAAKRYGVRAEVRKYRPEELGLVPMPAIVQLTNRLSSLTPWHFDVMYKLDSHHVYLLDGTTGRRVSEDRSRFNDAWTGFALVETRSIPFGWWPSGRSLALAILADAAALGIFIWALKRQQRGVAP